MKKTFIYILIVIILVLLIVFIYKGLDNEIVITRYELSSPKVKSDLRIALITDLHSDKYKEDQLEIYNKLKKENPDLIIMSGDIIDDVMPPTRGYKTVKYFPKIAPSYYVTGNHEIWIGDFENIEKTLINYGINHVAGKVHHEIVIDNDINILGLDDPEIGGLYQRQLSNIKNFKSDNLNILLAHRPERIKEYNKLDVDLVLSGHAHGGQWRIPYLLENGLIAPNQGLFPKHTKGVIDIGNNQRLIVSRGLSSNSTAVPRFYNPPEIVIINIKSE